jgi:hypothetical protein
VMREVGLNNYVPKSYVEAIEHGCSFFRKKA